MLQNTEAFTFFDPIIQKAAAFYETAGALDNGLALRELALIAHFACGLPEDGRSVSL
jgi:hypothetical protein